MGRLNRFGVFAERPLSGEKLPVISTGGNDCNQLGSDHSSGRMIEIFARGCEPTYRPTSAPTPIGIDTS
jgi:hypothetical protein